MSGIARWPVDHTPVTLSREDFLETLHPGVRAQLERAVVPIKHGATASVVPRVKTPRRRTADHMHEGGR